MAKKDKEKKAKRKKNGLSWKSRIFLIVLIMLGLVFLPTSTLIFFGMLPSLVAVFFSLKGRGARASTVTAMNMAGCIPFVFKLWSSGNTFEIAFEILTDAQALAVMYTAAAFGYMIDWVVTGLVSSYLYQKGVRRMKDIKKRQAVLIENWGRGVAAGLDVGDVGEKGAEPGSRPVTPSQPSPQQEPVETTPTPE